MAELSQREIDLKTHSLEIGESFEYDASILTEDGQTVVVRRVVTRRDVPKWWDQDEVPVNRHFSIDAIIDGNKIEGLSEERFTNYE